MKLFLVMTPWIKLLFTILENIKNTKSSMSLETILKNPIKMMTSESKSNI